VRPVIAWSEVLVQARSYCSPFIDQLDRDGLGPPLYHNCFSLGRPTVDFDCVVLSSSGWETDAEIPEIRAKQDQARWRVGFQVQELKDLSLCEMTS
jgi:hypothetical protein